MRVALRTSRINYGIPVDKHTDVPQHIHMSSMAFEWDQVKAESNLAKHGVSFETATRVFLDVGLLDIDTTRPEDGEVRRKVIGYIDGYPFTVVYTPRLDATRLISARRSNAMEVEAYG